MACLRIIEVAHFQGVTFVPISFNEHIGSNYSTGRGSRS